MSLPLLHRSATSHDDAFLRLLFADTHPTLSLLPEPIRTQLAEMQYRGRQLTYAANFPAAEDLILCLPDGTPAGRMLFAATSTGVHLIDIAVLPKHQGQGLAALALQHLQQLAGLGITTLQLTSGNPAERLYVRLGFRHTTQNETALQMLWHPASTAKLLDTCGTSIIDGGESASGFLPESTGTRSHTGSRPKPLPLKILSNIIGGGGRGAALALLLGLSGLATAQGILTVTPGKVISVSAGTGKVGYTGDGGPATSATLAAPSAVAYDTAGNLYLADSLNHVVREISASSGTITTIAGTGVAGFGGDNGAAMAAFLDTPTGVAVDASGNIYIADSHNNRIRKITSGTITTIAGTGIAGFSGDSGVATSAQLALPSAVALDASGNIYIADRNNHRIRKITGATIATIAGDGEELFAGDGGAATSAALDSPSGVAVDTVGNVYIADRNNLRIRVVNNGTISTLAGSGTGGFTGSFSGDGASATAAALAKPTGVSVDASGNVYIADTDNQRIREVSGSTIATIVGSGAQGFGADTATASGTNLNSPKAVASDSVGNLSIGDRLNQRVRSAALPVIAFASQSVGVASTPQPVTLANTGTASITVTSATYSSSFSAAANSPCGPLPITLSTGASCVENLLYTPLTTGSNTGSVVFGGTGVVPQSILLTGTAIKTGTIVALTESASSPFAAQVVTFTATANVAGTVPATGTITFTDGSAIVGSAPLVGGVAVLTTSALADGPHSIAAAYAGDLNYTGNTSSVLPLTVLDFNFNLATLLGPVTAVPGQSGVFTFTLQPLGGPFTIPVVLTATGLPSGATVTFNPQTITLGSTPTTFTMTVLTLVATLQHPGFLGGVTVAIGLLLLPLSRRLRRRGRNLRLLTLCGALVLSLAAVGGLAGCATQNGFLGQAQKSYTITITLTATSSTGAVLQRSTNVTLVVE